jgi:hypothetical protein
MMQTVDTGVGDQATVISAHLALHSRLFNLLTKQFHIGRANRIRTGVYGVKVRDPFLWTMTPPKIKKPPVSERLQPEPKRQILPIIRNLPSLDAPVRRPIGSALRSNRYGTCVS